MNSHLGVLKVQKSIGDIFEENKKLKTWVISLQRELTSLKETKLIKPEDLLTPAQIADKLGSTVLNEIGFFHARCKISGPQGSMLACGNLLTVLKNATITTGEFEHYKKMFLVCENEVDAAMQFYMGNNFVDEMRSCRRVQFLLGMLVARGYGLYTSDTYESILTEMEMGDKGSQ